MNAVQNLKRALTTRAHRVPDLAALSQQALDACDLASTALGALAPALVPGLWAAATTGIALVWARALAAPDDRG